MTNKLVVIGRMYELSIQPITKKQFDTLTKRGRECELYDYLSEQAGGSIESSGYYTKDGFPTFEVYVNDKPLGIEKRFKTDFEITYLPVHGSTQPTKGREKFFFITEKGYKKGHTGLVIEEEFNERNLTFVVERQGLPNKMVCNTISPMYKGQELEFDWNWSGYESSYIVSTKGIHYDLAQAE